MPAPRVLVHRSRAGPSHELCIAGAHGCRRCTCLLAGGSLGWLIAWTLTGTPPGIVLLIVPMSADLVRTRALGGQQLPAIVTATSLLAGAAAGALIGTVWLSRSPSEQWSALAVLVVGAAALGCWRRRTLRPRAGRSEREVERRPEPAGDR